MDLEEELRLLSMLAGACLSLFPAALQAQTVWDMPTEYPQNAMPGVGLTAFTKHVAESSAGKLEIRPSFDAKAGIDLDGTEVIRGWASIVQLAAKVSVANDATLLFAAGTPEGGGLAVVERSAFGARGVRRSS